MQELNKQSHKENEIIFQKEKRLTQMLVYYSTKLKIDVNPHMLRHTFASRCYAAGLDPKLIQKLLGHETIDTTLNTYTHVLTIDEKEIIITMKKYLTDAGLIIKID